MVCYSVLLTFSFFSPPLSSFFFRPRSHRETADHIEAVANRAVRASKQTFGFLMDLLQDNSTEEYIRNLTERSAQQGIQTDTHADKHKQKKMSHIHLKHLVLQNPNKLHDSLNYCLPQYISTKCTYPCVTAQGSLPYRGLLKHRGV